LTENTIILGKVSNTKTLNVASRDNRDIWTERRKKEREEKQIIT